MAMELYCSDWTPYRHVASAIEQLANGAEFTRKDIAALGGSLGDPQYGPFIAMCDDPYRPPAIGMRGVIEALHRMMPGAGLLPEDLVARAFSRAFSEKVEEGIARIGFASIDTHPHYMGPRWLPGSRAREAILTDFAPRFQVLDDMIGSRPAAFIADKQATMADALMAAYWWMIEDIGEISRFDGFAHLKSWSASCVGSRFVKPESA